MGNRGRAQVREFHGPTRGHMSREDRPLRTIGTESRVG